MSPPPPSLFCLFISREIALSAPQISTSDRTHARTDPKLSSRSTKPRTKQQHTNAHHHSLGAPINQSMENDTAVSQHSGRRPTEVMRFLGCKQVLKSQQIFISPSFSLSAPRSMSHSSPKMLAVQRSASSLSRGAPVRPKCLSLESTVDHCLGARDGAWIRSGRHNSRSSTRTRAAECSGESAARPGPPACARPLRGVARAWRIRRMHECQSWAK